MGFDCISSGSLPFVFLKTFKLSPFDLSIVILRRYFFYICSSISFFLRCLDDFFANSMSSLFTPP